MVGYASLKRLLLKTNPWIWHAESLGRVAQSPIVKKRGVPSLAPPTVIPKKVIKIFHNKNGINSDNFGLIRSPVTQSKKKTDEKSGIPWCASLVARVVSH